jgi:hypothetical protein
VIPQTGTSYGSTSAGTGGGGQQIQFLVADQGGLIDMRSIVINYTIFTSANTVVPDDGHPFLTFQALLNGQLLEQQQNAPKVTNAEMTLGGSKTYYQTAGSFQGFELLNNDLVTTVPSSSTTASITSYGYVAGNVAAIGLRSNRAAAATFNNIAGEQRSIPLGLISGLGRMRQYLPISLVGELAFVLITGQAGDVLFNSSSATTGDFSLSQVSLEYDVVVPDTRYMEVLQTVAMEDGAGLVMPYESTIVTTGGAISSSASVTESSLIVSRATNHLLRAAVVQVPTTVISSINYPSQCCFSHAGVVSLQFRIGSQVYPQIAASGDASIFNMSLLAYGAVDNENGGTTNRCLWANSTNPSSAGTPAVYETSETATSSTTNVKFAYADRFVGAYGFSTIKGAAEPLMVDGVSLAGASGSQLIVSILSAPATNYTPYVILTALRFIKAGGGAVSVVGA